MQSRAFIALSWASSDELAKIGLYTDTTHLDGSTKAVPGWGVSGLPRNATPDFVVKHVESEVALRSNRLVDRATPYLRHLEQCRARKHQGNTILAVVLGKQHDCSSM